MPDREIHGQNATQASFDETRWSLILPAASNRSPGAREALEQLCKLYWPPIYSFLRKQGRTPEDAQDLTQGFFMHLLARERLGRVHPAKGKFRSFLLACLGNYLHNQRDRDCAQKRGGGRPAISIDLSQTESELSAEPATLDDPALAFERRWAGVLIEEVLRKLASRYHEEGKAEMFSLLRPFLMGDAARGGYAEAAARIGMSQGALRVSVSRLRDEFRDLLRAEVGRTVASPEEVQEEIRHLFRSLRHPENRT